ncbi:MAG: cytochrome c-type biosis protein [Acidobacteriota bacterium]|jgi:cytochrome c-type biogenesis protein|nr:cytochrome c-type biosis protein [Acidobacteriota bacterium]
MEGTNITIWVAFLAGLLSFLSPCVLPLVPGYVSLISGVSIDHLKSGDDSRKNARRAVILNSIAFNIGLSMIFLSLGVLAGLLGKTITANPWFRIIGGIVIIGFGFQLMGLLKIGALYKDTRFFSQQKPRGMLGSLTLGMAFAAGWTPCIGPILGGIIGLAATSGNWKTGLYLSCFYAAGLAVPFLATGLAINQFMGFYAKFRKHLHKVEVVSGVMLISIGLLVATNKVAVLNAWFSKWIPDASAVLDRKDSKAETLPPIEMSQVVPAPEVELKNVAGAPFRLSDLHGRVVLLNFWGTWCVPCREEIPELNEMYRGLESAGLTVVGASWNSPISDILAFQHEIKIDYPILLDSENVGDKFGGIGSFPTTFIIDREGRIRYKVPGQRNRATFEAAVKLLLNEAPPATASK